MAGGEKTSTRFRPPDRRIAIPVPPIVSEEAFQAAHEQLQRNLQLATRRGTSSRERLHHHARDRVLPVRSRRGQALLRRARRPRRAAADGTAAALGEQQAAARKGVQWAETQSPRLGGAYEAGVLELEDFQAHGVKKRRATAKAELLQAEADLRHNVELTAIISTFEGFRGLMWRV